MLDRFKTLLRDQVELPAWVVLTLTGLVGHIALNAILRRPVTSAWGLLAPLTLRAALESYEIWVSYRALGLFAPSNDPLLAIRLRHGLDIVMMLVLPAALVATAAFSSR